MIEANKVWHNGQLIEWKEATVHVMTHGLHYGSGCFEGIRCYETKRGPEVFRLEEHVSRLYKSARVYRMEIPFQPAEFSQACLETVRANNFKHCYIRPLVFRGVGAIGVNPLANPVESYILTWEWGKYLGEEAIEQGIDVCISSWSRPAPNTTPTLAKATGNYGAGGLIKMEALLNGFAEGIALDTRGYVSEGSGENLFVAYQGELWTPDVSHAILPGITRDSVITLAEENGYTIRQAGIPREMLYIADEMFFCGTAAEITPIRSVDKISVGSGARGPITAELQERFFEYVEGRVEDRFSWLTPVYS